MCGSDRILRDREMSKSGGGAVGAGVVGVKWGNESRDSTLSVSERECAWRIITLF